MFKQPVISLPATLLPPSTTFSDARLRVHGMFEQHHRFVSGSLRMLGVMRADLEDATQEVFLVVFQRFTEYEERGRARTWLYSICMRVAWGRRRAHRRRRDELGCDVPEVASSPTQLDRIVDAQALELGRELLAGLPFEQRQVFWLYEVEERSMPAIARMLGCPLQTAYSRLHAARARVLAAVKRAESQP